MLRLYEALDGPDEPVHRPDTELLDDICLENEKDVSHFIGK